jgi:dynein intermediate chain 2
LSASETAARTPTPARYATRATPCRHEDDDKFIVQQPSSTKLEAAPVMAEHEVNTDSVVHRSQGLKHAEGGWPENVDGTEAEQVERYLKKASKDAKIKSTMVNLGFVVDTCLRQNNTVDIYEEYFKGEEVDHSAEPPSARGLAVFRDPNATKRTACKIHWHPEGTKVAVAYSVLQFQDPRMMGGRLPMKSYIWSLANPNAPERTLIPQSPLMCLRYHHKLTDVLVGGCYNGLVCVFDSRASSAAVLTADKTSEVETSHHDPVYDAFWIQSKSNSTFASVSTDGQLMMWEMRNLSRPLDDVYELKDSAGRLLGGSSLEYNPEANGKFLVGTEQGGMVLVNTKKKGGKDTVKVFDTGAAKHHGPVYQVHRNPFHTKFFMSVGDWTAKVWSEDNHTPIMSTHYCKSYLSAGCWSPTRAGVFFTTRMDGVLDVWDYYHRQSAVAYSHKVSDHPLASIAVQGNPQDGGGKLVAVGDANGTVSLLEVSNSLSSSQHNEKTNVGNMLEREAIREKALEVRAAVLAKAAKAAEKNASKAAASAAESKEDEMAEVLRSVDTEFLKMIKDAEQEDEEGFDDYGDDADAAAAASASGAGMR